MFSRNLRYFRLRKQMTKKELASRAGLSSMALSYYEKGERMPGMETLKRLAAVLDVNVSDFLRAHDTDLTFRHGEFRKRGELTSFEEEYIREAIEEYCSRLFTVIEILGGDLIPHSPSAGTLTLSDDFEEDSALLRELLGFPSSGPLGNITNHLENIGIIVIPVEKAPAGFSGTKGFVNDIPYIAVNDDMSGERQRSTIGHELAHLFFSWPEKTDERKRETTATAVSGAFLFPSEDAKRELGLKRKRASYDLSLISEEYGISMYLLMKRAEKTGIINSSTARKFYLLAESLGWNTNEPERIAREKPLMLEKLVFRAVSEGEISVQKGAELLSEPYCDFASRYSCFEV